MKHWNQAFRWSKISMINVNFNDPVAFVTTKDAKVTFADMLGTIRGTLGIFLGLSIVGLVNSSIKVFFKIKSTITKNIKK